MLIYFTGEIQQKREKVNQELEEIEAKFNAQLNREIENQTVSEDANMPVLMDTTDPADLRNSKILDKSRKMETDSDEYDEEQDESKYSLIKKTFSNLYYNLICFRTKFGKSSGQE